MLADDACVCCVLGCTDLPASQASHNVTDAIIALLLFCSCRFCSVLAHLVAIGQPLQLAAMTDDLSDAPAPPRHEQEGGGEPEADQVSLSSNDEEVQQENEDTFDPSTSTAPAAIVLDTESFAMVRNDRRRASDSVATTADLASSVGSVLLAEREAFLKSFTIQKNSDVITNERNNWGISFKDPIRTSRFSKRDKSKLYVDTVDENGLFALSRIREGDYLKSINGRRVGPSLLSGDLALKRMQECLDKEGIVCVSTKNKEESADDVLVHATIIKPRPDMTYRDLGMVVWYWGYLCIKEIKKDSIFKQSVLKETDNIVCINEIKCEDMKAEQFAQVIGALPREVTITVLRRKQRATGNFA